ncbi:permease [Altericroceibacterium spongiae]|uniref:Permease n=1 Tax=Altericroceibacterium spongiae TaxID=2320269 RepID=A0A420EF05_9SPHN|nr:permease [Altericroceibacterium spongiae]RKF19248.1 permease [Altericroceibacterium spongiae]
MTETAANIAGFTGMACIIAAYGYGTAKAQPDLFIQHGTNLAGALLLTLSLLVNTNPASLTLEFFWALIAVYGLIRAFRDRRHKRRNAPIKDRQS